VSDFSFMTVGQILRVAGTGLSFALFGVGGIILGTLAGLVMRIVIFDRELRARFARQLISRAFLAFGAFMSLLGVLRYRVHGLDHCRQGQPFLVIANHPTLIDVIFLLAIFRGADCVVKEKVVRNPFWGLLVHSAGYVSNADTGALIDEAVARLRAGRTVIMFPEGTRSMPGGPLRFKPVAASISIQAGVACLPVVVTCVPATLYKGCPWYRVPERRPELHFLLRAPLSPPAAEADRTRQRQLARGFSSQLEAYFAGELERLL
jgi:1-acyl-sn-glycerol-3-phosphate acyltransferase